jgi:hypothetical protein
MNDMLLLMLAVPSRVTEIKKDDLMATAGEGAGAKARGLLKRADNLYSDLPRHHETLRGELDRDRAELDDLLANPPGPFEHTGELMHPPGQPNALIGRRRRHPHIGDQHPRLMLFDEFDREVVIPGDSTASTAEHWPHNGLPAPRGPDKGAAKQGDPPPHRRGRDLP